MKVAILGWPSTDTEKNLREENTGNVVYRRAVELTVDEVSEYVEWHDADGIEASKADIFVVPMANAFSKFFRPEYLIEVWSRAQRPIVAIGLGANAPTCYQHPTVSSLTIDFVRLFDAIFTRGDFSTMCLLHHGIESISGVCPSLFMNPRTDLGQALDYSKEMNVVGVMNEPGCYRGELVEDVLLNYCTGNFFLQSPKELLDLWRNGGPPMKLPQGGVARKTHHALEPWVEDIQKHDLIIGPRFHGPALAVQSEVPGICVAIDSRTEELCASSRVPCLMAEDLTGFMDNCQKPAGESLVCEGLPSVTFDGDAFDRNRRRKAQTYVWFLREHSLKPTDHLKKLAGE